MIQVHSSAVADPGAKVGDFTSIWHFCRVEGRAVIGENCNLGQNVYVGNGCRLGNSVSVFSHVELDVFVSCAPFMVSNYISFPRAAVNRRTTFHKTIVKTGTTLGANSTAVLGITIGSSTFLATSGTLTKCSKDWSLMAGSPSWQGKCLWRENTPSP